jgi:hypothetical protein
MGRRLERTLVPCPGAVSWRFIADLWRGAAGQGRTHILGLFVCPNGKTSPRQKQPCEAFGAPETSFLALGVCSACVWRKIALLEHDGR